MNEQIKALAEQIAPAPHPMMNASVARSYAQDNAAAVKGLSAFAAAILAECGRGEGKEPERGPTRRDFPEMPSFAFPLRGSLVGRKVVDAKGEVFLSVGLRYNDRDSNGDIADYLAALLNREHEEGRL